MDFEKYKNKLKQYLKVKGFDPSNNPMFCFSSSHNNKNTPACMINDHNFNCGSCGIHGDIYDACEIITGITEKAGQFKEVEKTLLGYNIEKYPENKKEKFKYDSEAFAKLIIYLKKHGGRKKGVMSFLKQRGYIDEIAKKMLPYFVYWPGFDIALQEIGRDVLKGAGVPLVHPQKNYSTWSPAGVIVKLAKGLKLCFYRENICEKRNTKACSVFPGPYKIDYDIPVILVEAEITAIAMRALGWKNVIPTGGTNGMTIIAMKEHLLNAKEIIFAFDGDESGRKASCIIKQTKTDKNKKKAYPDLLFKNDHKGIIKLAHLPDGKDPDDLIQENKIDNLKKIILDAKQYKPEKKEIIYKTNVNGHYPFFFLGFDSRKNHYVLPKRFYVPLSIPMTDSGIKSMMKAIAPWNWWFNSFQKEDAEGNASFDMLGAIEWFHEKSASKGLYNDDNVLGIGAYKDGDDIVFNTGGNLLINNKKIEYENYEGKNIYTRSKTILKMEGIPWTIEEGYNLIKQLRTFNFEKKIDYIVICGYIAIAWIASLLKRRPHIWITAESETGKTTLLESLIVPLCGKKQSIHIENLSSEAFFRQECRKDCRVPIIDEFEAYKKEDVLQQDKYFHFIRSAYSGSLAGKGTANQMETIKFNIKLMFCVASVNTRFPRRADRSRFIICNMLPKSINDENLVETPKNPHGLKLRIFKKINYINEYIEKAKKILTKNKYNYRLADTYSPFLVGFWLTVSDNHFFEGDEQLQDFILEKMEEVSPGEIKSDDDKIFNRILQERVRIDPSTELTIAEMLIIKEINTQQGGEKLKYDEQIRRYGIRRCIQKDNDTLAIDTDHPEIKKMLRESSFSEYKEILQRHPDVIEKSKVVYMSGKNTRCIIFSWEKLENRYFREKIDDDIPF